MKKGKWVLSVLLLAACLSCVVLLIRRNAPVELSKVEQDIAQNVANSMPAEAPEEQTPENKADPAEDYVSPVDFGVLQAANPDIYAWLYIPGTMVNYPLLQREEDDEFYLDHNSQQEQDAKGALFTQGAYNSKDFTDPATVIYGHYLRSGGMFGQLQQLYSEESGLETYKNIYVYLPDRVQCYTVFAAAPYSNSHILYYTDFHDAAEYQGFLDGIYSTRALEANVNLEAEATPEDQILILSTCLIGNNQKRYLVLAKRTDDRPTIPEVPAGNS